MSSRLDEETVRFPEAYEPSEADTGISRTRKNSDTCESSATLPCFEDPVG